MGFAVPAALGVQVARPDLRAVVIVGDGAFQMTGMELSTLVRHKFPAIIIVLDNGGYGTERFLHPAATSTTFSPGNITSCPKCSAAARATKSAPKASSTRALKQRLGRHQRAELDASSHRPPTTSAPHCAAWPNV